MGSRDWGDYFGNEVEDRYEPDEKQDHSEADISHDATSPKDGTDIRLVLTSDSPRFGELFLGAEK